MQYFEIIPNNAMKLPIMSGLGYSDIDCAYGPVIRDMYIVHYIVTGRGYFDGKPLEAGQGFIIYPGDEHEYHYDKSEPWSYLWFKSSDEDIIPFLELHNAEDGIFTYSNLQEVDTLVNRIRMNGNHPMSGTQIIEYFVRIFNRCIVSNNPDESSSSKKYFSYCKNYIDLNINLPITVGTLCEFLGITQPYLYKIFKNEIGMSPKKYIVQRKILQAKSMLLETNASISTIATSLGFYDTLAFSKFFKSMAGTSPSAFRNSK